MTTLNDQQKLAIEQIDGSSMIIAGPGSGKTFVIVEKVLTEDILKDLDKYEEINGLSFSPKKEFNICKIWLRNHNKDYKEYLKEYSPQFDYSRALFKKHDVQN